MKEYVIVTDSSCDIAREIAESWGITVIDLEVNIEGIGTKYNSEIDAKEFYSYLRDKRSAKTSAANMDRFYGVFEKEICAGKDVIYLGFSSGLSATYSAGKNAALEIMENYPDSKVIAVDTLCAAFGQGLLVKLAVDKKNEGASIEELAEYRGDKHAPITADDLKKILGGELPPL